MMAATSSERIAMDVGDSRLRAAMAFEIQSEQSCRRGHGERCEIGTTQRKKQLSSPTIQQVGKIRSS
jgi:hypothetical protein